MVENIENLRAELHVEPLRDPLDVVVLEQGEVQVRQARADQNITAGVAAEVVTQWKGHRCSDAWRQRIAILVPKCHIRRRGYSEALGFDVVVGVSGVRKGVTAGPTQPVRKCPVVATVGICRV